MAQRLKITDVGALDATSLTAVTYCISTGNLMRQCQEERKEMKKMRNYNGQTRFDCFYTVRVHKLVLINDKDALFL